MSSVAAVADSASGAPIPKRATDIARWANAAPDEPVSPDDLIWAWLRQGWAYRWVRNPRMHSHRDEYVARIKMEMELVIEKKFTSYFLMLSDVCRFAKDEGVPVGPARGSAAASLVCYLLRITEVDPMMFPTMLFERFIDHNRTDEPDVDLDFDDELRYKIRDHLVARYGADHVGNLGAYTRYRGKNSIVDVSRVYGIPKWSAEIVKGLIVERSGGDSRFDASLEDTFELFPKAAEQLKKFPEYNNAMRLEGNYKGLTVHAAGLVVCNSPINNFCATYAREVKGHKVEVVSVDKYDAEPLGLLKADFLGLTTMGMIRLCLEMVNMPLDELYQVPIDDAETLDAFNRCDVVGIFQFEGRATRLVTQDVVPENFMELADINALSRPGPLFSGATAAYVASKHGRPLPHHVASLKGLNPLVDKIIEPTYHQIVYQEQILLICGEVGDMGWVHRNAIRSIISKKKGEAAFNALQDQFIEGAARKGVAAGEALDIWKRMITAGSYAFNIAHCISYSLLGFWQMYLKVHHPDAFYAAQLQKTPKEKWPRLLKDAERHGIAILAPDLNESGRTWSRTSTGDGSPAVRAGYTQIPGIGEKTAEMILAQRAGVFDGAFNSWEDLITVRGIGPKSMEKIREFCYSDDPWALEHAHRVLEEVRGMLKRRELGAVPQPTHTSDQMDPNGQHRVVFVGIPHSKNYQDYAENQRARTGEEMEDVMARITHKDLLTSCVVHCHDDGDEDVYLRFERTKSYPRHKGDLEDLAVDGSTVVIIAGTKVDGFGVAIKVDSMWVLELTDDDDEADTDTDEEPS